MFCHFFQNDSHINAMLRNSFGVVWVKGQIGGQKGFEKAILGNTFYKTEGFLLGISLITSPPSP